MQVCKYENIQVCKHASIHVCNYVCMQVYEKIVYFSNVEYFEGGGAVQIFRFVPNFPNSNNWSMVLIFRGKDPSSNRNPYISLFVCMSTKINETCKIGYFMLNSIPESMHICMYASMLVCKFLGHQFFFDPKKISVVEWGGWGGGLQSHFHVKLNFC